MEERAHRSNAGYLICFICLWECARDVLKENVGCSRNYGKGSMRGGRGTGCITCGGGCGAERGCGLE